MSKFGFFLSRLSEPSTWAALAGLAALAGHGIPADMVSAAPVLAGIVAGSLGVVLNERGRPD